MFLKRRTRPLGTQALCGDGERKCHESDKVFDLDDNYFTSKYDPVEKKTTRVMYNSTHLPTRLKGSRSLSPPRLLNGTRRYVTRMKKHVGQSTTRHHSDCGIKGEESVVSAREAAGQSVRTTLNRHRLKAFSGTGKISKKHVSRHSNRTWKVIDDVGDTHSSTRHTRSHLRRNENCENVQPSNKDPVLRGTTEAIDEPIIVSDIQPSPFVQSLNPLIFKHRTTALPISVLKGDNSGVCGDDIDPIGCAEGPGSCPEYPTLIPAVGESSPENKSVTQAIFQTLFGHTAQKMNESDRDEELRYSAGEGGGGGCESRSGVAPQSITLDEKSELLPRSNSNRCRSWDSGLDYGGSGSGNDSRVACEAAGRPRSNSLKLSSMSPLLSRSHVFAEVTPLLSSAAFEYALAVAATPSDKKECNARTSSHTVSVRLQSEPVVKSSVLLCAGADTERAEHLPPPIPDVKSSLLEEYVTEDLVSQLVLQLAHDNSLQGQSPHLSVLKALHKNCTYTRHSIVRALGLASYNRVLRCRESDRTAKEMGVHYSKASEDVFRRHFSGEDTSLANFHCSVRDEAALQPLPIRSPAPRAHCAVPSNGASAAPSHNTETNFRDHDESLVELTLFVALSEFSSPPRPLSQRDVDLVTALVGVVINVLQCYGSHFSSAAGSIDDCVTLRGVTDVVHTCLRYASCSASGSRDSYFNCAEHLLGNLLKHWPRGDTVREMAFWRVAAAVLPYTLQAQGAHSATAPSPDPPISEETAPAFFPRSSRAMKLLPSRRFMKKVIESVSSSHFMIAIQAIEVLVQRSVNFVSMSSSIRNGNCASSSGSDINLYSHPPAAKLPGPTEAVAALRCNRGHWHAGVRASSEYALTVLLG